MQARTQVSKWSTFALGFGPQKVEPFAANALSYGRRKAMSESQTLRLLGWTLGTIVVLAFVLNAVA